MSGRARDAQFRSDLGGGSALGGEASGTPYDRAFAFCRPRGLARVAKGGRQMFLLVGKFDKLESEKVGGLAVGFGAALGGGEVVFFECENGHVMFDIDGPAGADLDLFQVTVFGRRAAAADGKDRIGKIGQIDRTLQILIGDRHTRLPFVRVGEHEYRDVVLPLEAVERTHDVESDRGVRGRRLVEDGDVIDDENGRLEFPHEIAHVGVKHLGKAVVALEDLAVPIVDGAKQVAGKFVIRRGVELAAVAGRITHDKLAVAQLKIDVEHPLRLERGQPRAVKWCHAFAACERFGNLDAQHTLARAGRPKHQCQLAALPKWPEQQVRRPVLGPDREPGRRPPADQHVRRLGKRLGVTLFRLADHLLHPLNIPRVRPLSRLPQFDPGLDRRPLKFFHPVHFDKILLVPPL